MTINEFQLNKTTTPRWIYIGCWGELRGEGSLSSSIFDKLKISSCHREKLQVGKLVSYGDLWLKKMECFSIRKFLAAACIFLTLSSGNFHIICNTKSPYTFLFLPPFFNLTRKNGGFLNKKSWDLFILCNKYW